MNNFEQKNKLMNINENSIFYKIKSFFNNFFNKNRRTNDKNEKNIIPVEQSKAKKSDFINSVKKIENEETKLQMLQKQYRNGEVKEEDLTDEQIDALCDLFDKQIEQLKKENEIRKNKIIEFKRKKI